MKSKFLDILAFDGANDHTNVTSPHITLPSVRARETGGRALTLALRQKCRVLDSLASATAGSAGVDVATAVDITLLDTQVALLIGHSSVSHRGIFVVPGLIDADFCGNIKIMVYTLCPPVSIPKGEKIAQLVPFEAKVPCQGERERGSGGFGSTGQPENWWTNNYRQVM
uniref:Uncharacterized protein n=1 Tax=Melopsittacus undulatus TaxID=13146 RepID=A0A8C6IYF2_MELUD